MECIEILNIDRSFDLYEIEKKIFEYLKKVVRNRCKNVELRVAGGWVRDKILGYESDDIDIVLNIMGMTFAEHVQDEMVSDGILVHRSSNVIKANPEQSKHLETATMKLFGVWLDFVNLRTEMYIDGRIPQMSIGTARDDAYRRDLTINSLFYNINLDVIEDYTGRGLNDLERRIIDTPLDPVQTFSDDPLRILRAIRFASRLNFNFIDSLEESINNNHDIKECLRTKISRDRFGIEIWKIMKGNNPQIALHYICQMGICDIIFATPMYIEEIGLSRVLKLLEIYTLSYHNEFDKYKEELLMATFLSQYASLTYVDENGRINSVIQYVISISLKLSNHISYTVVGITYNSLSWKDILVSNKPASRLKLGTLIRDAKDLWLHSLVLAWITLHIDGIPCKNWEEELQQIRDFNLDNPKNSWDIKPLFNGKELIVELGVKQGPQVGKLLNIQIEWMFENFVEQKNREDSKIGCREYMSSIINLI